MLKTLIAILVLLPTTVFASTDLNGDNKVNIKDLSLIAKTWGTNNPTGDVNEDGIVDILDLSLLAKDWGVTTENNEGLNEGTEEATF